MVLIITSKVLLFCLISPSILLEQQFNCLLKCQNFPFACTSPQLSAFVSISTAGVTWLLFLLTASRCRLQHQTPTAADNCYH